MGFPAGANGTGKKHFWSLGQEDPLQDSMGTHSSILALRIPWTEEPGGLQSTDPERVRYDQSHFACMNTII